MCRKQPPEIHLLMVLWRVTGSACEGINPSEDSWVPGLPQDRLCYKSKQCQLAVSLSHAACLLTLQAALTNPLALTECRPSVVHFPSLGL